MDEKEPKLEETIEKTEQTNEENLNQKEEYKQPKKNKKSLIIAIIIAVIAVLCGGTTYYIITSRTTWILNRGFKQLENQFKTNIEFMKINTDNGYTEEGLLNLKLTLDKEMQKSLEETNPMGDILITSLNGMSFPYKIQISDNKIYGEIKPTISKKELMNLKYYMNGDKSYIFLEKLFDKYIEMDQKISLDESLKSEEITYLWNKIGDSFKKNMDKKYITKSQAEINYNDKNIKVNKTTFKLTNTEGIEYFNNILKDLKEDEKANSLLTRIYPEFKEYTIPEEQKREQEEEISFSVYTNIMNQILGTELVYKEYEEDFQTEKMIENNTKIEFINDKIPEFVLFKNNQKLLTMRVVKDEKSIKLLFENQAGTQLADMQLTSSKEELKVITNFYINTAQYRFTLTNNTKELEKNKKYETDVNLEFSMIESGTNKITTSITGKATQTATANIDINVKDNVKLEDLTEEQTLEIYGKLLEIIGTIFQEQISA